MLKALKLKLYPTKEQATHMDKLFGCYRKVYNLSLDYKKNEYDTNKRNVGLSELGKMFHNTWLKDPDMFYLGEHNTKVLKQSIINVLDAYKRFFTQEKVGFPKFKKKSDKQTARFPAEAISKVQDFSKKRINLIKQLKNLKFDASKKYVNYLIKYGDNIKSATLSKSKAGYYYLSVLIDLENVKGNYKQAQNLITGIDVGIKDFIVSSTGDKFENIKTIRNNEKKLEKLHRNLSRKQKGSNNRYKAKKKLAKFHQKIHNIKENYLHHVTNHLLDKNHIIVMEDLNVKGMMANHKLAKAIQELSLYKLKTMLSYKANWRGNIILEIDRYFPSSKMCSCCGDKNNGLTLSDREWQCNTCNTIHDRDENASINIRNEGIRMIEDDKQLSENINSFYIYWLENMENSTNISIDKSDGAAIEYLKNIKNLGTF